jgi:hypothetical protein
MMFKRILGLLCAGGLSLLLLAAGCAGPGGDEGIGISTGPEEAVAAPTPGEPAPAPEPAGPVTLALKFTPGRTTNYRLTMEDARSVDFSGKMANDGSLKGGQTGSRIQMDFSERIESVDDKGTAAAKITIKALKYLSQEKDVVRLDFDSSREKDRKNVLNKLVGQGYTIELTPDGKVVRVLNMQDATRSVRGVTPMHKRASALLRTTVIKARHSIGAIPGADKSQVRVGDDWSSVKTFDFTMLGKKSYERIYLLKEIQKADGHNVAVIEMNAIPTTEGQGSQPNEGAGLSQMFDNIEKYTGQLRLDLASGRVEKYSERLHSEWFLVDLGADKSQVDPDSLTMTAVRVHSVERID